MDRRFLQVVLCLAVASFVRGDIAVVGDPVEVVVTGKTASQVVFYNGGTEQTGSSITPIGPLAQDQGIKLESGLGPESMRFVRITVDLDKADWPYGKSYSGALVFSNPVGQIPVKITRAAPVFTLDVVYADMCVACDGPHVVPVKIKNTGGVPIERIRVGPMTLHTSAHDWVVPQPAEQEAGEGAVTATTTATTDTAPHHDELTFAPGTEAPLPLAPGESRTIYVSYEPPRFAGDYAGSIEVSVAGVEAVKTAVTLRARGPNVLFACFPVFLFFLILGTSAWLSWLLEDHFGAGGGAIRGDALLSLNDTKKQLQSFIDWIKVWDADAKKLPKTLNHAERDVIDIREALDDAAARTPEELRDEAMKFRTTLAKRRIFRDRLLWAAGKIGDAAAAAKLDPVPDDGTTDDYKKALDAALATESSLTEVIRTVAPAQDDDSGSIAALRKKQRNMKWLRRWSVIAISLALAFLALYYGKCAFGTARDYAETFFWGLGLTATGNALLREGNTLYKKEGNG